MQECRVCGLLFLGGGACPTCGSQVAVDVETDDIVMDDESIPGLDEIADAIGDTEDETKSAADNLPFGMGAKAEVIQSSLPFGVGSFSDSVTEIAIPISEDDYDEVSNESISLGDESEIEQVPDVEVLVEDEPQFDEPEMHEVDVEEQHYAPSETMSSSVIEEPTKTSELQEPISKVVEHVSTEEVVVDEVPDMWRIDAAAVDMDAIYAQDEQIVEVSFEEDLGDSDVQVSFDDFHYSPEEDSMASDEDAPELHPARALPVDSAGQPEIATMIDAAFEHMGNSAWMQAAQILSTASTNRQDDPSILNNLGLALLQSALEMDSQSDPMSDSQYEAAIMALRQGAKIDSSNNTILLNLSHALLVSGRAEKALGVLNVLRGRTQNDVEVENAFGACLIQLGRDEEAQSILEPYAGDSVVSVNLALI
jgi:Flp pilus assembly protein TadD